MVLNKHITNIQNIINTSITNVKQLNPHAFIIMDDILQSKGEWQRNAY